MKTARNVRRMTPADVDRREFVRTMGVVSAAVGGVALGVPVFGEEKTPPAPARPETNIADFMKVPRGKGSIPGPFPGKVVQVADARALVDNKVNAQVVDSMFRRGLSALTGKDPQASFRLLFSPADIVGLKVNPVGPLINTKFELVDAVINWLVEGGLPRGNVVIWDRFADMLKDSGYVAARFPGVRIEGLQTMVPKGQSFRDAKGRHISADNFDLDAFYLAKGVMGKSVPGYASDDDYEHQHVFTGEYSYFGKLLTRNLTKIINLPVFKNTLDGVSMATKNLGYGAICNTGRLHKTLFFDVCTEVLAAPVIRDKLVLNVMDGLRGQYDGGPMPNEAFMFAHRTLYLATDPFAMDMIGQLQIVEKRKAEKVKINEHPRFTEYLRYGQKLGLGIADPAKIQLVRLSA